MYALFGLGALACAARLPMAALAKPPAGGAPGAAPGAAPDAQGARRAPLAALRELAAIAALWPFLLFALVAGYAFAAINGYVYLWLVDGLGGSYALVGAASLVLTLSEVPILLRSRDLLERHGVARALWLTSAAYAARLGIYCVMTTRTRWLILVSEPLHALTFSLTNVALGAHLKRVVDEERGGRGAAAAGAAASGVLFACASLGRAAGFLIGGELYTRDCARAIWVGTLEVAVPVLVALASAFDALERRRERRLRSKADGVADGGADTLCCAFDGDADVEIRSVASAPFHRPPSAPAPAPG